VTVNTCNDCYDYLWMRRMNVECFYKGDFLEDGGMLGSDWIVNLWHAVWLDYGLPSIDPADATVRYVWELIL
jgi:hypothetical protein